MKWKKQDAEQHARRTLETSDGGSLSEGTGGSWTDRELGISTFMLFNV